MLVHTLNTTRARAWCFTINNYSEEEKKHIEEIILGARYGIAETEHNDEGTPHIQGYIYWENPKRFQEAKRIIGERAHIEVAKGSPTQNYEYCSKEKRVFVERPMAKGKIPFLTFWNDLEHMTIEEIKTKYPYEWFNKREKIMNTLIDNARKNIKCYDGILEEKNIWLWGEPGVGKSRWAASNGDYSEIFKKNYNKWWDGYNLLETKIVILEDYPAAPQGQALAQHLKIWGDRYPFTAECKGSHLVVEPGRFFLIVTSNYPIDRCFDNPEDAAAIHRRFREREVRNGDLFSTLAFKLDRKWIN